MSNIHVLVLLALYTCVIILISYQRGKDVESKQRDQECIECAFQKKSE